MRLHFPDVVFVIQLRSDGDFRHTFEYNRKVSDMDHKKLFDRDEIKWFYAQTLTLNHPQTIYNKPLNDTVQMKKKLSVTIS